jgi:hypothetical protein
MIGPSRGVQPVRSECSGRSVDRRVDNAQPLGADWVDAGFLISKIRADVKLSASQKL